MSIDGIRMIEKKVVDLINSTPTLNETHYRKNDDGGFGRAFETYLGIPENNRNESDYIGENGERLELKSKKSNSGSKITLFCMEPSWSVNEEFPKIDSLLDLLKNDDDKLNSAVRSDTENNHGLKLDVQGEKMYMLLDGDKVCFWEMERLCNKAEEKLENVLVAKGDESRGVESASLYKDLDVNRFRELLCDGKLVVEFRVKLKNDGRIRNRGTCFRIAENYISSLYKQSRREIL